MTAAAATPAAEPAAAGAANNAKGMARRLRALLSPVQAAAANAPAPAATATATAAAAAQPPAARTPDRGPRRPPTVAAAASPSSASSCQSLEEGDAAAAAAMGAGIEVSPLEGPHISLSEAAKRLASPPRLSAERSMMRPGEKFWEQYELTGRLLGVGGFALVYEAVCTQDAVWGDARWTFRVTKGQRVAAKVMTTRRVDVGCIREEMDLMRQLQHPNVCSVVDPYLYAMHEPIGGGRRNGNGAGGKDGWKPGDRFFPAPDDSFSPSRRETDRALHRYREEVEQYPYIMVLELCDCGSLYDYIMTGTPPEKPRSVAQAKRIFLDVLLGMHYLSSKLMVHQDIKIDNIYLCTIREGASDEPTYHEDGSISLVAKVGDLGLARLVGGRGSSSLPPKAEAEAVGRFQCCHLSPDVRLGTLHPHASDDVYSLGLALFEFLTQERLNTTELGVSVRLTLRAYLRAKAASAANAFQDFLPLLHRLLHEHRLLRPRLDELILDPVFCERRAWLVARLLGAPQQPSQQPPARAEEAVLVREPVAEQGDRHPPPQDHHRRRRRHHHHHGGGSLALLLRQGRRDQLEDVGSRYKGRSVLLYKKKRPRPAGARGGKGQEPEGEGEDGGDSRTLRATFSFEDLRDDLQRSFHAKQQRALVGGGEAAPTLTLVVSASRNDWKTINNREASTCSAILEMETRPISPASATSPANAAARRPLAANAAAAYFKRHDHQQSQPRGSSSGCSSLGRISEGISGPQWSAVVSFDHAFRAVAPRSSRPARRRRAGPFGPLLSLSSLSSRSSSSGAGSGGGGALHASSYLGGEDAALLELERVDGQPFRTVDRLFLGLFDRPRRLARLPFSVPRHFFSWRSLWDLYQALRLSVHQLCPPHAPAPAVLILPLIGLVYRRETGPCVFVSDDSARKFVLQEIIGLVDYYARATTAEQLLCVHVVSWNAATKGVIVEDGLHSLDGDDPQPSPAALLELVTDAVEAFAAAAAPQLNEHQPDLVPALRAALHEGPPLSTNKPSDAPPSAAATTASRRSGSWGFGGHSQGQGQGHGQGQGQSQLLQLQHEQQLSSAALVPRTLPGYSSSSTLTANTSCTSSPPVPPPAQPQPQPQVPPQHQQALTPEAVVERCFEAALELSMALPHEVPSPLVDLTLRPASPPPHAAPDGSGHGSGGHGHGGHSSSTGGGGGGGALLQDQCRLHVEVLKYNEMKRRYDRDGLGCSSSYVPMTGPMEAARSAVALEAMLRLLAGHADAVNWGWCTPDLAVLSPKARLQLRANQRLQRRLERALDEGAQDRGDVVGCWGEGGDGCCAVS